MKQIILGTAGHIDHGKTSLIRALTGINTDRLKEEQKRGITIELGFASLDLPSGRHLGIVDVPGHEKFVKNMVAGASGIDIVAMVIAADEGVMPQTREHMEICTLLGVRFGLVVLTKIDMVDEEWLELVMEDVREFMEGTFLEGKPIIPVSSVTGEGLEKFTDTLDAMSADIPEHTSDGILRLPVDRVFTMKGFGTVVTGTIISGSVKPGQPVMIYPSKLTAKVRGVQVHNESVEEAGSGLRTAINFQGLERDSIARGDVISGPDDLIPGYMVDVAFTYLASNPKPIRNRTLVRFHSGTSEVLGNLILLDREELKPNETAVAQLRLDSPVALMKDDRFVIRSYSPVRTIGGGGVLNPIPKKHKRFKEEIIDKLNNLLEMTLEDIISFHVAESGFQGTSFSELKIMTNTTEKKLQKAIQGLLSSRTLLVLDREKNTYLHGSVMERLDREACGFLAAYHKKNPLKAGMPKEELKSKFPRLQTGKVFNLLVNQLLKEKKIVQEEETVRLADHKVSLAADQESVRKKILDAYRSTGLTPPYFKDLCLSFDMDARQARDVLALLIEEGHIVKVKEDLFFDAETIGNLKRKTIDFLKQHDEMTTPQFKGIAGVSRKYLIPLLEYFDSVNVTIRVGDTRKLRAKT